MQKVENQMTVTAYLRNFIREQVHKPSGKKRFQLLDGGDVGCLPVVSARLNPELGLHYNDIDMQHALSESHWYVSGYSLGFEHPSTMKFDSLFSDVDQSASMFRIVVKSNLTRPLAEDLTKKLAEVIELLDSMDSGYESLRSKVHALGLKKEDVPILTKAAPKTVIERNAGGDRRLDIRGVAEAMFWAQSFKKNNRNKIVTQHIC